MIEVKTFEDEQLTFERVRKAYADAGKTVNERSFKLGVTEEFGNIYIRVFKREKILEMWIQRPDGYFVRFKDYPICMASGKLGPKRKEGDYQVPEGFYTINVFNPMSLYFLSLGLSYPNESDRILGESANLGGDIYIHGNCASIGCLAMTDPVIEEIYVCAVKAKSKGQQEIPVHIFPFKMSKKNLDPYLSAMRNASLKKFWLNLQQGYMFFERNNRIPAVSVDSTGSYLFD